MIQIISKMIRIFLSLHKMAKKWFVIRIWFVIRPFTKTNSSIFIYTKKIASKVVSTLRCKIDQFYTVVCWQPNFFGPLCPQRQLQLHTRCSYRLLKPRHVGHPISSFDLEVVSEICIGAWTQMGECECDIFVKMDKDKWRWPFSIVPVVQHE